MKEKGMPGRKAVATIVPVERRGYRYEARTEIEGMRTGKLIKATVPLVDREQVEEWKRHFVTTAQQVGHQVEVNDTTRGR
ncbi:hypothetical protein K1T35_47405 (plasmid) [Pseudonocardia sp. DSM 110487]|uniref:hypothetical protein n=1 Tax=Pseudonocardia sp. DSM 110487 TaxID=2865833 RepID=UPI001C6A2C73|nr:hypothetical protein [Pseudonocardia sp. DSM 110487]QYN40977.1 hypothetical protein K1T35_47405 [Pseudonocardia sp. DSM 110487]